MEILQLVHIDVTGFLGFSSTVSLDLSTGVYAVVGQNRTEDGCDSNGSGKSSLLDAVAWGLYGKLPRRVTTDEVVNIACDRAEVGMVFRSPDRPDVTITRTKTKGKSQQLSVLVDGQDIPEERVAEVQEWIEHNVTGCSYEDFLNFYYLTGTAAETFFSTDTDPAQRYAVLSRLLGLDLYDACRTEALSELRVVKAAVDANETTETRIVGDLAKLPTDADLDSQLESQRSRLAGANAQRKFLGSVLTLLQQAEELVRESARLQEQVEAKHSALEAATANAEATIAGIKEWMNKVDVADLDDQREALQEQRDKVQSDHDVRHDSLQKEIASRRSRQADIGAEIVQANAQLAELRTALQRAVHYCPQCGAGLVVLSSGEIIAHDSNARARIEENVQTITALVEEKTEESNSITNQIDQLQSVVRQIRADRDAEVAELDAQILSLRQQVQSVVESQKTINALRDNLAVLERQHGLAVERLDQYRAEHSSWFAEHPDVSTDQDSITGETARCRGEDYTWQQTEADSRVMIERLTGQRGERTRLQGQLDTVTVELAGLRHTAAHLTFWSAEFPAIRDRVVSGFLPMFEAEANRNLATMGMRERVEFRLSSLTKEGKERPRFSIQVHDGTCWRTSQTYSAGEWGRVAVAIGFALRAVLSYKVSQELGLFLCDEVLDRFDTTGIPYFFKMLEGFSGTALVVSHRPAAELGGYATYTITVTKSATETTVEVSG